MFAGNSVRWTLAALVLGIVWAGWLYGDGEWRPSDPVLEPATHFDRREGVIDGQVAIGFWPARTESGQRPGDSTGFEVHLVPRDDLDVELVHAAGTWFQPPLGTYRYWLERDGLMSVMHGVIHYEPAPGSFGFPVMFPVKPAGKVYVSEELSEGSTLSLLYLESSFLGQLVPVGMSRRAAPELAHEGVRMPAGRVMAGIWDDEAAEYTAVALVEVQPNGTLEVSPRPPAEGRSAAVVTLRRPSRGGTPPRVADDHVAAYLTTQDGMEVPADAVGRTMGRIYAIWLSLPSGSASLTVEAPEAELAGPTELRLESGRVTSQDFVLSPRAGS